MNADRSVGLTLPDSTSAPKGQRSLSESVDIPPGTPHLVVPREGLSGQEDSWAAPGVSSFHTAPSLSQQLPQKIIRSCFSTSPGRRQGTFITFGVWRHF